MNVFTTCLQADWAERIGWTLLHSLWQIALVAAAYTVVSLLFRNRSADFRYETGCAALLGMLGLPIGTYVLLSHDSAPASTEVGNSHALAELPGKTPVPPNNVGQNDAVTVDPWNPIAPPDPAPCGIVSAPDVADPVATDLSSALRPWLPWATVAWLMGVLLLLLRPLWGWLHMRRLQRHGLLRLSDKLRHVGERLTHRLGVKQAVRFAQSALVEVPAVVGYLRPMVLLPASAITGLSAAEIELILAHELAHVRRHDSLVNLAQTVIEALLFYHPGMWWISNEIRKERENCCDDVAVALSRNRVRYLQALARLEEQRSAAPGAVLAATGGSLLARVRRLLGQPTSEFGYYKATAGLAGLVTVGFVAAALAMNQAPREAPENSPEESVEETVEAGDLSEEAANHTVRPVEAHQSTVGHHELRNLDDAKAQARSADHGPLSADNPQSNESVDSDKSADATSFRLPTAPIEQSHRLAVAELSKPKKLRDRRPAGLEDLESPQAVQWAVEQAMRDLAKLSQLERKWSSDPRTRLRYLGDRAFDAMVDGIRGDNRVVAVQSCALLRSHGERAVPPLISVLKTHTDEHIRAAAAGALGQTYHPDAFQPLIDALEDESQSVRMHACRALGYFRDARAIAPLSKRVGDPNGHVARDSIQWIRQPLTEGPAYWPPQLLKVRKLTVDARTLKGEQFGQPEIDVLVEHLQSKYWDVRVQCLHALASLNANTW